MSTTLYRLGDSTVAEPLVDGWVAWPHLIPPVPHSLHLRNYQIGLLESYLKFPKLHVKTCQNPQFRYGPFIDIPEERVNEVKELLAGTKDRQAENLKLAESVVQFHDLLVKEAKGQSLEPFYEQTPEPLKGYVELVYDYYNRPIVRHLEHLLYRSPYYNDQTQSLRLFRLKCDNARSFFMSTPRLPAPEAVDWFVPFESSTVDEFYKLDSSPKPAGYVREMLGLSDSEESRLLPLLSEKPIAQGKKWDGEGVRMRYIGHACVLVEWNGISILTDPWIGVMPEEGGIRRITYADLPEKIDYALVTHGHPDHFGLETLLRLRHKIECLVVHRSFGIHYGDISVKLLCRRIGFKQIVELDTFESIHVKDGEILAVPFIGEQADMPHGKTAYVIRAGSEQMFFGADSNCLDRRMYEHLRKITGRIQTVFIGMECVGAPLSWMYGPLLPSKIDRNLDQSRRLVGCDSARALDILEAVGATRVYVYAMGLEPWLEYQLGLAVSDDSVQIQEAHKLTAAARQRDFVEAKLLRGTCDIHINSH